MTQATIETRTIRKLQSRIIPFVFVLFVISFLDRINIGFAALTMNRELAITSQEYGLLDFADYRAGDGRLLSFQRVQGGQWEAAYARPLTPGSVRVDRLP